MKILSIFEAVHKNLPPEWWRRRGSGSKLHNPDWMKGFYYPLNSWSYSRRIMQCHLLFSFIHQAYLRRSRLNVDMLQFFFSTGFFRSQISMVLFILSFFNPSNPLWTFLRTRKLGPGININLFPFLDLSSEKIF